MYSANKEALSSILDHISQSIRERVVFQTDLEPDATALWCAATYFMEVWNTFPKLLIVSPERECGKTTMLQALEPFARNAFLASSITPAALYRLIEAEAPTLLIDEADTFLKHNEELRGLINAGHTRRAACKVLTAPTPDGQHTSKRVPLWCAQAIAGIGEFADTIHSRSIVIGLRRKGANEDIVYLDDQFFDEQVDIRTALESISAETGKAVLELDVPKPASAVNRRWDNWKPLFQVAALAGGGWPVRARDAFEELEVTQKAYSSEMSSNELLLALRDLIDAKSPPEISSTVLLDTLLRSAPDWHTANNGRAITAKWLTGQLRPYGVQARKRAKCNVYLIADLADAFNRYLPPQN